MKPLTSLRVNKRSAIFKLSSRRTETCLLTGGQVQKAVKLPNFMVGYPFF